MINKLESLYSLDPALQSALNKIVDKQNEIIDEVNNLLEVHPKLAKDLERKRIFEKAMLEDTPPGQDRANND